MVQVPYKPYPTVEPAEQPEPEFGVQATPQAFGVNVANAMEHLGGSLEKDGDQLWQRAMAMQEVHNKAEADVGFTQYAKQAALMHEDFRKKLGKSAEDALPGYLGSLETSRASIGQGLSSPAARQMYDAESRSILRQSTFAAARHAGDEGKKYVVGSAEAVRESYRQMASQIQDLGPENEAAFQGWIQKGMEQTLAIGAAEGWSKPQMDVESKKWVSSMWAHMLSGMSKYKAQDASQLLEKVLEKGYLVGDDVWKTQNTVYGNAQNYGLKAIVEKYVAPFDRLVPPGEAPPDRKKAEDSAVAEAEAAFPGVPMIGARARDWFTSRYGNIERGKAQDVRQWNSTLLSEYLKLDEAGVKMDGITDLISRSPVASATYDAMSPPEKEAFERKFRGLNAARDRVTNDEFMKQIEGMKNTEEGKLAIAQLDPTDPKYRLSLSNIRYINALKDRASAGKPIDDIRVKYVMNHLRSAWGGELSSMGVLKYDKNDPEKYFNFLGSVQAAIEVWAQKNPKRGMPTAKEMDEDIKPGLVTAWTTPHPIFGDWLGVKERIYERYTPTDAFRRDFIAERMSEGKGMPSDEEISRGWMIKQFMELDKLMEKMGRFPLPHEFPRRPPGKEEPKGRSATEDIDPRLAGP